MVILLFGEDGGARHGTAAFFNQSFWTRAVFFCAMDRLGNVDWSYSAWYSANSPFFLLLLGFLWSSSIDTCFNSTLLAGCSPK